MALLTARPMRIRALVPAHNEEETIVQTIASLRVQTRAVEEIVVVVDRCDDRTEELARAAGAEVMSIARNRHRKAGALNIALRETLATGAEDTAVLVVDADSTLGPRFVETAAGLLEENSSVGAVGGIFYAARRGNLLEQLQANEYARYAREIERRGGDARVITGTGALFRGTALRDVAEARAAGRLPGGGDVYDTLALTEDNELTLALKSLGWLCVSPEECVVKTDTMPTVGSLWRQRMRWQRGALENLRAHGWNRTTAPYTLRQGYVGVTVLVWALLGLMTLGSVVRGEFHLVPFWTALTGIFWLERLVSVRCAGLRGVAIAAPLMIEAAYDLFIMAVYVTSIADLVTGRRARWA
jgi:biofilm PGA synthesis N-glycosyltransferase PgaC